MSQDNHSDSYDSNEEQDLATQIVPRRSNESSVTRLSRNMVRDYIQAKDKVRHFTPDLGNRRVRFQQYGSQSRPKDSKMVHE